MCYCLSLQSFERTLYVAQFFMLKSNIAKVFFVSIFFKFRCKRVNRLSDIALLATLLYLELKKAKLEKMFLRILRRI